MSAHEAQIRRLAKRVDCRLEKSRRLADNWNGRPYAVVSNYSNTCIMVDGTLDDAEHSIRHEAKQQGVDLPRSVRLHGLAA